MFIAMNRFKINLNHDEDFEQVWRERETFLSEVPGFLKFALLRGPQYDSHVLYVSHSTWETEEAFHAWTKSEAFKTLTGSLVHPKAPISHTLT